VWERPSRWSPAWQTRLQTQAIWEVVVLILNRLLFILVGLQPQPILASLRGNSTLRSTKSKARLLATRAALARIDELARELKVPADLVDDVREHYADNDRRFTARFHGSESEVEDYERRAEAYRRFQRALLEVERGAVVDLRNKGVINDEVMSLAQSDIDLEEVRQGA